MGKLPPLHSVATKIKKAAAWPRILFTHAHSIFSVGAHSEKLKKRLTDRSLEAGIMSMSYHALDSHKQSIKQLKLPRPSEEVDPLQKGGQLQDAPAAPQPLVMQISDVTAFVSIYTPLMIESAKKISNHGNIKGNTTNCFVCVNILYILINILWPNGT